MATLEEVLQLCEELENTKDNIDLVLEELKTLKDKEKKLAERLLPEMFEELGLTELKLKSGRKISYKTTVFGKFPVSELDYSAVVSYLHNAKAENLLKTTVTVESEYREAVNEMLSLLSDKQVPFQSKESMHPQTFNKFVREALATDPNFPKEAFGVVEVTSVEVTTK